jgi:hypothetical protein
MNYKGLDRVRQSEVLFELQTGLFDVNTFVCFLINLRGKRIILSWGEGEEQLQFQDKTVILYIF